MKPNRKLILRTKVILDVIKFQNYCFIVRESHGGVFIQGQYPERDVYSREPSLQLTRKWLLSPEMTSSEIVSTIFKLCMTSMEHRTREGFLYAGRRIYSPHLNVEDLWTLCKDRENAGGRA